MIPDNVQGSEKTAQEGNTTGTGPNECRPAKQPEEKKLSGTNIAVFKLLLWYIFGVAVSFIAIGLAAAFDYYLGYNIQAIKINRISDFLLALLATSSGLVNILIEAKRPRSLNCKILLGLIPAITIVFSLGFYCFLYERSVNNNIAARNDLLFWISLGVLIVNVCIGTGLILVSEKGELRK